MNVHSLVDQLSYICVYYSQLTVLFPTQLENHSRKTIVSIPCGLHHASSDAQYFFSVTHPQGI